jgi:hypothetical protein
VFWRLLSIARQLGMRKPWRYDLQGLQPPDRPGDASPVIHPRPAVIHFR